jgi:YkoP domain
MSEPLADYAPGAGKNAPGVGWLQSAVFALDRRIRRQIGVYEYTLHPQCLFRLQVVRTEDPLLLEDGTFVSPGSRVLVLHLWNEQMPVIGRTGPTLAWARKIDRAMDISLGELTCYLATHPHLRDIAVICANMPVIGSRQAGRLARILSRYGFEMTVDGTDRRGLLHRFGDGVLVLMLVWAANPRAVRSALLRCCNMRVCVSRAALEQRYMASLRTATPA